MIIRNKKELADSKLRKIALGLIEVGIKNVLPSNLMRSAIQYNGKQKILTAQNKFSISQKEFSKKYSLKNGRIFVIGGGKAAGLMAEEIEKIIGFNNITAGVVNSKSDNYKVKKVKVIKASHPIPNMNGVNGVKKMLLLKKQYSINKNDLVICLISGGASSLMPSPVAGINLKDIQGVTKLLLSSGAQIQEINTVRKHLSKIKGGQLGKFFKPATVVSLIISDVVGNDLKTIGSGLTVADTSTFNHAYKILKKYGLLKKAPKNVIAYFKKGCEGKADEISEKLDNCYNYIIGDNRTALQAMECKANQLGLKPLIVTAEQTGDPARAAKARAREIINKKYKNYNVILIGGETTPTLPADYGKGGRNQHYIAASILAMKKYHNNWAIASISTDGSDYLTDVAGAIVDNDSLALTENKKIDINLYLKKYDSNGLFKKIGKSLIRTGDTGTNVGDIIVYVLGSVKD